MRYAVWMNGWDTQGRDPEELLDFLEDHGLNACNLGLRYHGGRMLLPMHSDRVVYEHRQGEPALCDGFLRAAARRKFEVRAWVVLCHNDEGAGEHNIVNAFGERYPYALCPAHPEVQERCLAICRSAAETEGITGLDIEALSFMGYEHGGLHEKRGVPMNAEAAWWLSICCCEICSQSYPGLPESIRARIRRWLDDPYAPVQHEDGVDVIQHRRNVQVSLLRRIRDTLPGIVLNVRTSPDERFSGGKCSLPLACMRGLADEVTFSFFGAPVNSMQIPEQRPVPVHCGFVFHEPDCRTEQDVGNRFNAVSADGYSFYGFSMAARPHWRWLKQALKGSRT